MITDQPKLELPHTELIESDGIGLSKEERFVEFRLLYQGILRSNGGVEDKFTIRRQIHPQLKRLWSEYPLLRDMTWRCGAPASDGTEQGAFDAGIRSLADTQLNGFRFLPLSRKEWHLRCSLDVLFLRREKPGKVFMRGDIDNRFKTLFDALQMPLQGQDVEGQTPHEGEDPFYVLLAEDDLIADVSLTTDRLLAVPAEHIHTRDYAVLVIDVKLQPTQLSNWNHVFN